MFSQCGLGGSKPNIVLIGAAKPIRSWDTLGPNLGPLFGQNWAPFCAKLLKMAALFWDRKFEPQIWRPY